MTPPPNHRRWRLAALAGFVLAAGLFFVLGGDDALRDTDAIRDFLTDTGPLGPLVFVASMWAIQPLGLPGFLWMVPAGLLWSWPVAAGLSWIGNMGASVIAFAFARFVARDWVAARIPPRILAFDERLAAGGTAPVVALRLVTGQLPPADWLLGLTSVGWRPFLVGTGVGIVPGILVFVIVGSSLFTWLADLVRG